MTLTGVVAVRTGLNVFDVGSMLFRSLGAPQQRRRGCVLFMAQKRYLHYVWSLWHALPGLRRLRALAKDDANEREHFCVSVARNLNIPQNVLDVPVCICSVLFLDVIFPRGLLFCETARGKWCVLVIDHCNSGRALGKTNGYDIANILRFVHFISLMVLTLVFLLAWRK